MAQMNGNQKSGAQQQRDRMRQLQEGHGLIYRNKEKDHKDPEHGKWCDYKGELNVEGVYYFVNAWINVTQSGRRYLSLRLKRKEARNLKEWDT